ncbi:MAG: response regulator transcription factor, partial [Anaerolineae bacterium]|nr:response regulator transcription factor [Anaerolineae bacterium]
MASQLIETLFVSSTDHKMVTALDGAFYHVQRVGEPGQAMEMLRSGQIDLILLDDELFSNDIVRMVKEIKRRVPLLPVLVISKNTDSAYQTGLMEAGADDILTAKLSAEELQRRLRLVMRQRRQ